MIFEFRRAVHAAHYGHGHPAKGHDLEEWDVIHPVKPSRALLEDAGVPFDVEYHSGYIDHEGRQHWLFVRRAPLSPGKCARCDVQP